VWDDPEFAQALPSDTVCALHLLRREQFLPGLPPIFLVNQLYSIVKDATAVDQELEYLIQSRIIRLIHLNTSRKDMAVVFVIDARSFLEQVRSEVSLKRSLSEKNALVAFKRDSSLLDHGFDAFTSDLLDNCTQPWISKVRLLEALHLVRSAEDRERAVQLLLDVGVLLRRDVDTFWVTLPRIGLLVRSLTAGRRELIQVLRRAPYAEMYREELCAHRLKSTHLTVPFLLRDMLGCAMLKEVEAPGGMIIRIR